MQEKLKIKLEGSCAKLSLALASYLLLWTSCEFDMDMDTSWKEWTSHEQANNKSWTSHKKVMNKSSRRREQVMSKSRTIHEQVKNTKP